MEEILTKVTTIEEEEKRTGKKIEVPSASELVSKSGASIIVNRKHLSAILPKLGKRALQRVLLAALDLPADGVPVKFTTQEEKVAFRLCQGITRAMFTVMYHHVTEEIIRNRKEEQTKQEESKCQENLTHNSQSAGSKMEQKENISQPPKDEIKK